MKTKFFTLTAIGLLALSASAVTLANKPLIGVKADEETGKDMAGIYDWKASDGNFVTIDNWYYSGLGFSYEFKLKNTAASSIHETIITLLNGSTAVTDIKDLATGQYRAHNFATGKYSGEIGFMVPLGDDWYRYELMLADLNPFIKNGANKNATVNGMKWNWGYYNDCYMKNMKVIDHYSPEAYINTTTTTNIQFSVKNPTNDPGSQGGFSPVLNWKTSGKGFSIEFENKGTKQEIVYNLYAGTTQISENARMIKGNSIPAGNPGKLFDLGNDWYRYEVMYKDMTAKSGYEEQELTAVNIIWVSNGYGASKYQCIKHINAYTCDVTFDDGTSTNKVTVQGKLTKPEDPTAPAGKHFTGWYTENTFENKWDFDKVVEKDMTLYAGFDNHDYQFKFDDNGHWKSCECGDIDPTSVGVHVLEEIQDPLYMKNPATCTRPATYYKSCECGFISTDTFTAGDLDPENHIYATVPTMENFVAPTCTEQGGYDDVIRCTECQKIHSSVHHDIPAIGHSYEAKEWTLDEDKTSATVKLVCANDAAHIALVTANVRVDRVEPTTQKEGLIIYTMSAIYEGKNYSSTITESIPKKPEPKDDPVSGGCGGSIVASTILLSTLSLAGACVLIAKKKKGE